MNAQKETLLKRVFENRSLAVSAEDTVLMMVLN